MKLSQMTTSQAADALMVIAPEIQPILLDAELMADFRKTTTDRGKAVEVGVQKIVNLIPVIFGKYRLNVFRILSALNDMAPDEIAAQNVLATIRQVQELVTDKELIDFFMPSKSTEPDK